MVDQLSNFCIDQETGKVFPVSFCCRCFSLVQVRCPVADVFDSDGGRQSVVAHVCALSYSSNFHNFVTLDLIDCNAIFCCQFCKCVGTKYTGDEGRTDAQNECQLDI